MGGIGGGDGQRQAARGQRLLLSGVCVCVEQDLVQCSTCVYFIFMGGSVSLCIDVEGCVLCGRIGFHLTSFR